MFECSVYQHPEFLKILEDIYKIKRVEIFEDRDLSNIMTFYQSQIKRSDIFNMPFNFYCSPSIDKAIEEKYFNTLYQFSLANNVNILIKSLNKYNLHKVLYAYNPVLYYKKDYKSFYSKNLIKNIKRNSNKAKRNDIVFYKSNNIEDIVDFYNYVLSTVYINKHQMVFQPLRLYLELFRANFMDVFIAKQNKRVVGGLCCIKDDNVYHYNWGASLNINNIAIGTLLIDYAVDFAYDKNYEMFDFGSTALSDKNLLDFKLKWGTYNHEVYEYYTLKKPQSIDLNSSYMFARNVYSRLPKPFLRWLMPKVVPYLVQ